MNFFKSNGDLKLSVSTDFSEHYRRAVDSLYKESGLIYSSGDIEIKGDTFDFFGKKDVIILSIKGYKRIYMYSMESFNDSGETSIETRRSFEIDFMKNINKTDIHLYIDGLISKELGYVNGLLHMINEYDHGLKVAFLKTIFKKDDEQEKYPAIDYNDADILVKYYLSPELNLFVDYLVSRELMPSEDSKIFNGLESDVYPVIMPYIKQFYIQHDYLLKTAEENHFTCDTPYSYNDSDYSFFVSHNGNLAIQDQNTYYEFVKTCVGMDLYAYDVNIVDTKKIIIDPDNKYSCVFSLSNNEVRKVNSIYLYCIILDMYGAISSLKDDGFPEIRYPEDVTSLDYLVKYHMQTGQSKEDALIDCFLYGRYNADKQMMTDCETRYLVYRDCKNPEDIQRYSSMRTPLFRLSQLNDTLENIGELSHEWTDALRQIYLALKSNNDFGSYHNSDHNMEPSKYRRVMKMFDLDTDDKCQALRDKLLLSLETHISSTKTHTL